MPLHGKVVVIKRSGVDGTEFPLTAACVFGRKAECDIRIQLPQVSKEHCKIDLNENKEVIVTNLSSVNPTRINGEVLQQAERLKHGDLITIFDRSFRFEYPPEPTPKKKRSSIGGKAETRVLKDKQASDTTAAETVDKTSEAPTFPCLKDGTNNDNIQRTPEKTVEVESTDSPFGDLYQMIKKTLDSKPSPWKPSGSQPQTPATRFCTPQPVSVRKAAGEVATLPKAVECTPKEVKAEESSGITAVEGDAEVENVVVATPKSAKKEQKPLTEQAANPATPVQETLKIKRQSLTSKTKTPTATVATSSPLSQKKHQATPQKFTATEMDEQVSVEKPTLTPTRRKSKAATPIKPAVTEVQDQTEALPTTPKTIPSPRHSPRTAEKKRQVQEATPIKPAVTEMQDQAMVAEALPGTPKTNSSPRHSPRTAEKKLQAQKVTEAAAAATTNVTASKKRKSEELGADLSMPRMKRKRVSFGGHLSPELFDKRMPPDSPLRKGAAPRRSLCVPKLEKSLLRRASVSGFPKAKTPSPAKKSLKAKTPSPAKKSPKAKTPSPAKKSPKAKTPSPAKKSPKAKTPSPSPAKKSPKAKTPSPAKSPKAKTPSSAKKSPKVKTPSPPETPSTAKKSMSLVGFAALEGSTPTVQGRFSVSRISTPSPVAEETISAPEPSATMTPKLPLRRKSMKSTTRKSVGEAMRRRSGVSRASFKVKNSWADIVKFGQKKSQVVAQEVKKATAQIKKKAAAEAVEPKHKTPAKNVKNYASTGHADSPVSIVVGKAHKRVQPTGAAPRLVHNIVLLKNMKMDEDLTGIAEIFNTPVGAKQRKSSVVRVPPSATKTPVSTSVIEASSVVSVPPSATKTPVSTSVMEASVINTPEETGEMIVSPLAVASSAKSGKYNHEAVERLFEEPSFASEDEALVDDVSEQQCPDLETELTTTPQQKPPQPDCLTGVKRLLRTPRQKPEPVEDLRGKLLKTPKQKAEPVECLTGVKRIMKTPRKKAEPVEDIRGKLLVTPKPEKPEQPECLSGVKRMMKTPRQKAEPVVDLEGELLKTPKATAVVEEVSVDGVGELLETPIHKEPLKNLIDDAATTGTSEDMVNVESLMKTPKKVETVDVLMKTPKQMEEPVEESCPKSLMKTPRLSGNPPEEDLEEPLTNVSVQMATTESHDEMPPQNESDKSLQEPEVETIVPVSVDDTEEVKELSVEAENNTSLLAADDQQQSQQPTSTVAEEAEESQEPEVETVVPVSGDDAEEVQETPVEAENNTSLPADDDQQAPQQPTSTVAEEAEESQEPEVETVVPVSVDDAEEVQETPVEAENNTSLPADDDQQASQQPTSTVAEEAEESHEPEVETVVPVSGDDAEEVQETPVEAENNTSLPADDDQQASQQPTSTVAEEAEESQADKEAVIIPAEKPRRGGRKIKQDTKSESTEAQDLQLLIATETPKRGGRARKGTVVKEVEIMSEAKPEPAKDDVPEEILDDLPQSSTANEERVPVLKTSSKRGRGRKVKQDLPEAETQESSLKCSEPEVETIVPVSEDVADVVQEIPVEAENNSSLPADDDQQLDDAHSSTAIEEREMPVLKTRGRGRKALAETQGPHQEATPAEKPRRGGRKIKSAVPHESTDVLDKPLAIATETPKTGSPLKEETPVTEEPEERSATAIEKTEIPVLKKGGRGRKAKQDSEEAHEEAVVITTEPVMEEPEEKSATTSTAIEMPILKTRGRGRKAKQDLPEAVETEEAHEEAVVIQHEEAVVIPTEPVTEEPEEQSATTSTASEKIEIPVLKTRGRGRKAKQDLPEAVETEEAHEEAVVIPTPRKGGRKAKQDTQSVAHPESTEAQDLQLIIATEKPKRGGRAKKGTVVKEVEIVSEAKPEPAKDDVPEEKSEDAQSSTAVEESEMPVLKTRGRGRKAKQDLPEAETQEAHEEAVEAEKPRRGGARKKGSTMKEEKLIKEVEVISEPEEIPEHTQEDVEEENTGDVQTGTAIKKSEMPLLKTRGRGRKAKPELPEAVEETKEEHEEAVIPAEKPRRGGRKSKQETKSVVPTDSTDEPKQSVAEAEIIVKEVENEEETEEKPEPIQDGVQEEKPDDAPVVKARRGRKVNSAVKDDDSQATPAKRARRGEVLQEGPHEEAAPAEKPKRGGRKIKSAETPKKGSPLKEETPVTEEPEEKSATTSTAIEMPILKARGRGRKAKQDLPEAVETEEAREEAVIIPHEEAVVVETTVPATKSATRGRGKPKSESKAEGADSKTKVSAGPVRKGRKAAQATPPADDTVVVPSTEEGMEEVEDDQQNLPSKKSVVWKDDLTVTHVISPAVRAARGRKAKLADDVASPRTSPAKRDQSVECSASETTASTKPGSKRKAPRNASKAEEEDLSDKTVPSEPIKKARRGKSADAALVETVTPAPEVPETKPRRGRPAKK